MRDHTGLQSAYTCEQNKKGLSCDSPFFCGFTVSAYGSLKTAFESRSAEDRLNSCGQLILLSLRGIEILAERGVVSLDLGLCAGWQLPCCRMLSEDSHEDPS